MGGHLSDEGLAHGAVPSRGREILRLVVGGWAVLVVRAVQRGCEPEMGGGGEGGRHRDVNGPTPGGTPLCDPAV